jgi:serine phosphatase RsbU (regulator of sigma subunit)
MFGDFNYKNCKVRLLPGDRIVMYTDGVTDAVDDGSLVVRLGGPVAVTAGSPDNIKITFLKDALGLERMGEQPVDERA